MKPHELIDLIYDNGGVTCDRYTVITNLIPAYKNLARMSLGCSEGGRSFSQWGECEPGDHLGQEIEWSELDEATQAHINGRMAE